MPKSWLQRKAPGLHRFLTRRDGRWPLLREVLAGALLILLLVSALYGLTGQPLQGGYPVVVVTTGSMMHCEGAFPDRAGPQLGRHCTPTRWGRIGTIDPGDLVFVRRVGPESHVDTLAAEDGSHYGMEGDVLVFRPGGSLAATPIIHRALFFVQINGDGTFDVPALGIQRAASLENLRHLTDCDVTAGLAVHAHSGVVRGYVTRGDNNAFADACPGGPGLAREDWVLGKARGEVPWIGLVNLLWGDIRGGSSHFRDAGGDSKVMFFVTATALVTAPWIVEAFLRRRRRKQEAAGKAVEDEDGETGHEGPDPDAPHRR